MANPNMRPGEPSVNPSGRPVLIKNLIDYQLKEAIANTVIDSALAGEPAATAIVRTVKAALQREDN